MRGVDRRKIGFKLSHRELDRGHATTLAGDDGLRMRRGRDLLQQSISAHDRGRVKTRFFDLPDIGHGPARETMPRVFGGRIQPAMA
jgi:hypothetical protein